MFMPIPPRYTSKDISETQCIKCTTMTTKCLYDTKTSETIPACIEHLIILLYDLNITEKKKVGRDGLSSGT